jgi:hypothetical protein
MPVQGVQQVFVVRLHTNTLSWFHLNSAYAFSFCNLDKILIQKNQWQSLDTPELPQWFAAISHIPETHITAIFPLIM